MSHEKKNRYNVGEVTKANKKEVNVNYDLVQAIKGMEYEKGDFALINDNKISNYNIYQDAIEELKLQDQKSRNNFSGNISLYINKFCNKNTISKFINEKFDTNKILNAINNEISVIEKSNLQSIYDIKNYEFSVMNRIVVGYGGTTTYNNDMTFHHTYGIPYIPGQAIKGVFTNYILSNNQDNKYNDLINALGDEGKDINDEINSDNVENVRKSSIIFFDSFPKEGYKIVQDVTCCHHMNYYSQGKEFPLDSDDTNVIKFLAVEGTFNIRVGIDRAICNKEFNEKFAEALKDALYYIGVGGKTAVGYGILKEPDKK